MDRDIRVLHIEPDDDDAGSVAGSLGSMRCVLRRVCDRKSYAEALDSFAPDIVLSDYSLPGFDAIEALHMARERDAHIPFIVVTGPTNEETAVGCMRAGVTNYVLKDHLLRLQSAVQGALEARSSAEERMHAERECFEKGRMLREIIDNIPDNVWLKDLDGRFILVNAPLGQSCGRDPKDMVGLTDLDFFPSELANRYRSDDSDVAERGCRKCVEEPFEDLESGQRWIETIKTPFRNNDGRIAGTIGISHDITERKRMEQALEAKVAEIEKLNKFLVGREHRVIELKRENNALMVEMGLKPKYRI